MNKSKVFVISVIILALVLIGIGCAIKNNNPQRLTIATTTSVENSGLLNYLLPLFTEETGIAVDVVAVGTGQALALGENGDVDAVIVHAPDLEETFVASGYGTARYAIMYNDFILVGPNTTDFDMLQNISTATQFLTTVAENEVPFVSRGDNSGTHFLEQNLWAKTTVTPIDEMNWYFSIGQGMGATLLFADEQQAVTLTDRGTFLSQSRNLPNLTVLLGGTQIAENPDPDLYNYYSIIPINPDRHPETQIELATTLMEWLTSISTQELILEFGIEDFGQPLFIPNSELWKANN